MGSVGSGQLRLIQPRKGAPLDMTARSIACTLLTFAGCTAAAPTITPPTPQADASTQRDVDAGISMEDAGLEEVEDGGGLAPEDDAGANFDFDAGVPRSNDGGAPACAKVATGAVVTSTCASLLTRFSGGTIPLNADYVLTSVKVLGTSTFCSGSFVAYEHIGGIHIRAENGQPIFEFYDVYGRKGIMLKSVRRWDDKAVASGSQLTFFPVVPLCEVGPVPAKADYSVYVNGRTSMLDLRLPYGTGTAIYSFQKQ